MEFRQSRGLQTPGFTFHKALALFILLKVNKKKIIFFMVLQGDTDFDPSSQCFWLFLSNYNDSKVR